MVYYNRRCPAESEHMTCLGMIKKKPTSFGYICYPGIATDTASLKALTFYYAPWLHQMKPTVHPDEMIHMPPFTKAHVGYYFTPLGRVKICRTTPVITVTVTTVTTLTTVTIVITVQASQQLGSVESFMMNTA